MQEQPKLKKLPWSPLRKEVKQMYPGLSREELKINMDVIVKINRAHLPEAIKKKPNGLYPFEFIELMRVLGPPEGYEISPWIERQLDKQPKF